MLTTLFTPTIIGFCLALGVLAGFLGGLIGIGGGFILVPGLYVLFQTYFNLSPSSALLYSAGTAMAGVGLISLFSTYMNHRRQTVIWDVYRRMAPTLLAGAAIGAFVATRIDTQYMKLAFAAFCFYVGSRMLFSYTTEPSHDATLKTTHAAPYGLGFGLFSGVVGVGCATLLFSFLVKRQAKTRNALATASSLQLPVSLGATFSYVTFGGLSHATTGASPFTGFVSFPIVGLIGLGALLATPLGVRVSHALHTDILKRIFGVVAIVIGVHMSGVFESPRATSPKKINPPATTSIPITSKVTVEPALSAPSELSVSEPELKPIKNNGDEPRTTPKKPNPRNIR